MLTIALIVATVLAMPPASADQAAVDRAGLILGLERVPDTSIWSGNCLDCGGKETAQLGASGLMCLRCETTKTVDEVLGSFPYRTLAELLEQPDLLKPPECVLPRFAYRGRGVLLCGPDKSGKSTLLAHGAADLTRGRTFLGEATKAGRVVWCGLEEAIGDAVRRFSELDADPERIQLVTLTPEDLLQRTDALLGGWGADLVVIDSLQEYARVTSGETPADGDNAAWGAIARPLIAVARKHNVALTMLHHVRRSDGEGRGASEIFAAVDATLVLQMPTNAEDPALRRIHGRGRWPIERFSVRLEAGHFVLGGGEELSLDALILIHIERNPGCSKNALRQTVKGRSTKVDAAIHQLLGRGAIINRGTDRLPQFYVAGDQSEMGLR